MSEQSKEFSAECRTLRVGDVVTIHIHHYGNDPKGKPFTVTITKVDQRESSYHVGGVHGYNKVMPLLHWEPRDPEDYMEGSASGDRWPSANCDASFVTEIVARKPYVVNYNLVRNDLYKGRLHRNKRAIENGRKINQEYSNTKLQGPLYRVHSVASFAEDLLSYDAYLDIPWGINAERLTEEWKKANYPGLRGGFRWKDEKIVARYPHNQYDNGGISPFNVVEMVMHRRQFRDWLLVILPKIISTKQDLIAKGKSFADLDHQSYIDDCATDWQREFKATDEEDDDTLEAHVEKMTDWD